MKGIEHHTETLLSTDRWHQEPHPVLCVDDFADGVVQERVVVADATNLRIRLG